MPQPPTTRMPGCFAAKESMRCTCTQKSTRAAAARMASMFIAGDTRSPRLQQTSSRLVAHFNRREDGTGGTGGGPTQKAALVEQLGDSHTVPCALPQMKRRLVARTFHDKEPTTQAAHDLTESPLLQMCQGFGANNLSAMDGLPVQACCLRCRGIVRGEGCQDGDCPRGFEHACEKCLGPHPMNDPACPMRWQS